MANCTMDNVHEGFSIHKEFSAQRILSTWNIVWGILSARSAEHHTTGERLNYFSSRQHEQPCIITEDNMKDLNSK